MYAVRFAAVAPRRAATGFGNGGARQTREDGSRRERERGPYGRVVAKWVS